jgi:hypothetical protein
MSTIRAACGFRFMYMKISTGMCAFCMYWVPNGCMAVGYLLFLQVQIKDIIIMTLDIHLRASCPTPCAARQSTFQVLPFSNLPGEYNSSDRHATLERESFLHRLPHLPASPTAMAGPMPATSSWSADSVAASFESA